jgi:hypothetical protein
MVFLYLLLDIRYLMPVGGCKPQAAGLQKDSTRYFE